METGADLVDMTNHCCKMHFPVCDDLSNKELLLYIVDQFFNAAHDNCLHLDNDGNFCTKFCGILGSGLCVVWHGTSDAQAAKTVDNFMLDVDTLIAWYLQPAVHFDQIEYVCASTKPFDQSCKELASRLHIMSHLG